MLRYTGAAENFCTCKEVEVVSKKSVGAMLAGLEKVRMSNIPMESIRHSKNYKWSVNIQKNNFFFTLVLR